jgi:hypothetical protein
MEKQKEHKLNIPINREKLKFEIIDAIYGKGGWINYLLIKDYKITIQKNVKYYSLQLKDINTNIMIKSKVFNSLDECIDYVLSSSPTSF